MWHSRDTTLQPRHPRDWKSYSADHVFRASERHHRSVLRCRMFRALIAESVIEALNFLTESDTCDTCSLSSSVAKTPRSGQNLCIKRVEKLNESMTQKLGQRIGNQCNQAACACGLAIRESKRTLGTMAPYPGMIDNDRQARAENLTFQEWEPRDGMAWGDLKRYTNYRKSKE